MVKRLIGAGNGFPGAAEMAWPGVDFTTPKGDLVYNFLYDTTAGIPAVLLEQTGTTNKLYIRTPDGRLIARVTPGESPSLDFYYHFDGLGSTLALTDVDGDTTDTFNYDAWGQVSRLTGSTNQPYLFVGQLGYYSHYQEPMLSPFSTEVQKYVMLQLGVRYYVPEMGRFTQRDPAVAVGESTYVYASDRATVAVDADGRLPTINCPDKTRAGKVRHALSMICNALQSGKMDKCVKCATGPKQLQCLKDFCDVGSVQCGGWYCTHKPADKPKWPLPNCGYSGHTNGEQQPWKDITVCGSAFSNPVKCRGESPPGNAVMDTILHEMIHICGSKNQNSAIHKAAQCVRQVLGS